MVNKGVMAARTAAALAFVQRHIILCYQAFETASPDFRAPVSRGLIQMARTELSYSPTTVNCDIFRRLHQIYSRKDWSSIVAAAKSESDPPNKTTTS
jgi:hypothetical protein